MKKEAPSYASPNKVVIEGEKSTDSKKTDEPVIDAVT